MFCERNNNSKKAYVNKWDKKYEVAVTNCDKINFLRFMLRNNPNS